MANWGLEGRYLVVLQVLRVDEGVRVHARVLGVQPLLLLELLVPAAQTIGAHAHREGDKRGGSTERRAS